MRPIALLLAAVLVAGLLVCPADAKKPRRHQYEERELIPLYVNKIGPYANPSETYAYYSLPLCQPSANEIQHRHKTFHEAIEGDRPQSSLYKIHYKVDVLYQSLCTLHVGEEEAKELMKAIREEYYFEFQYDGIPIRGFLGTIDRSDGTDHFLLFKHMHFTLLYNGDNVIFVNVSADLSKLHDLREEEQEIEFSFSASWHPTEVKFKDRNQLIRDNFFSGSSELEIHWLSIMNSFVLVILLTGFIVVIVMRVLKSDYTRYARTDEEDDEEDYGWKLIHGDVFRFPEHKMLLSSLLGNGVQFLVLTMFLLFLHVVGVFYPGSGNSLYTAGLVLYALTAGIAGYVSSAFYKQIGGEKWAWNIVATACVFAVPFLTMALTVNVIASHYGATTAISFGTIMLIILIWAGLGFPLTVVGGITGKRLAGEFYSPVRTKNAKREIPSIPWYRRAPFQYLMAGFLPFSAIYIELYYVFASVWGHSHYTLYGILLLVAVILVIVTACITIALTYFQLSMEDYHWWWRSFVSGGSTGLFIFLYSCFYYTYRSRMTGFLQATFFFGYMGGAAYFFFIMLGTVGFYSALVFIRRIYANLHTD